MQCEILRWIALDGPPEQRPGLFLVGDPKQSIYGWRSADLRAYDGFVGGCGEAGGEVESLVENFRSVPAILEEVARAVEPVMRERAGGPAPLRAAAPLRPRAGRSRLPRAVDGGAGRRSSTGCPGRDGRPQGARSASERRRARGGGARRRPRAPSTGHGESLEGRWRSCCAASGELDSTWRRCAGRGVPFAVGRDKQYYRRREVIEAAALVRARARSRGPPGAAHRAPLRHGRRARRGPDPAVEPPVSQAG